MLEEDVSNCDRPHCYYPSVMKIKFIDLFCGIGGFRLAANQSGKKLNFASECVFSSDIDEDAKDTYEANFGDRPVGDITKVDENLIPDHDLLLGGFPCQAFSIIGEMKGFSDTRGTLFFDIARIIKAKKPRAIMLENVKQLRGHDGGRTLEVILETLDELGYWVDYRVLNALDFGLPQKRERIIIVGFRDESERHFGWPDTSLVKQKRLEKLLEEDATVPQFYFASKEIQKSRLKSVRGKAYPTGRTIWHENKSGNVSALPYSCALRAGASYNYLLVDGKRRMTEREMLRLQGFPENFKIVCGYGALRKLAGNSVPVPMIQSVISQIVIAMNATGNGWNFTESSYFPRLPGL